MDGFQSTASTPARSTRSSPRASGAAKRAAWDKAMARFQDTLVAIKTAMDAHAVVEKEMFAARKALDDMPFPDCLTVVTEVEVYIKDGVQPPLHRKSSQESQLKTRADISAYAGEDEALHDRLCEALGDYSRQRGVLAGAYQKADAIADAKYALSSAAITRSDREQRRLLCTPAPSFRELCWKIQALHRADCDDETERAGWAYVLGELAQFEARADDVIAA